MNTSVKTQYCVGIDIGTNSVGFAAIEVDEQNTPVAILNSVVYTHDGGVDPEKAKTAVTRLASAGVARRTRRLIQRRKKRLAQLDKMLQSRGFVISENSAFADPHHPWLVRKLLVETKLDREQLNIALPVALRHIARHRGWRSPYERIERLYERREFSPFMELLRKYVAEKVFVTLGEEVTPAQAVCALVSANGKLRGQGLHGKLHQQDLANEIHMIAETQKLDRELLKEIINSVFAAESPKGKAAELVKHDELPGQAKFKRAAKAHLEFQRFRIIATLMNLRISEGGGSSRKLTKEELNTVTEFLMTHDGSDGVTWLDVAETLQLDRNRLKGTAKAGNDAEHVGSNPPINTTHARIMGSSLKPLKQWWSKADSDEKNAMIAALSNAEALAETDPGAESVREFLASLEDTELEKLDGVNLPAGRAAYSVNSLQRLSERMLQHGEDLFTARQAEFGVANDWVPTPDPIGTPVGNPGVDRVLKIVNRWLNAAERRWGTPTSVNIEHVRGGFTSESQVREYNRQIERNRERNRKILLEMQERLGQAPAGERHSITKWLAISRQDSKCLYCGAEVNYFNAEMDHIVARKGVGSTNTRDNLAAVCVACNREKSNTLFSVWAASAARPEVSLEDAIERVKFWKDTDGLTKKQFDNFKRDVIARLKQTTEDEPMDNRSIESVAWMARELHERVKGHYASLGQECKVSVFKGAVTAAARKATGFEGKVELVGGKAKTRFDRRHHAMDAAVVAMMRPSVAKTLMERENLRATERQVPGSAPDWRQYSGDATEAKVLYSRWQNDMEILLQLFNEKLLADEVPVMQNLRLRLGNGKAHDDSIKKLRPKLVGEAWSIEEVDRAATPQLWCALTTQDDFDAVEGLPENQERELRVKNEWFKATDSVKILPKVIAAVAVRGGYAEIGNTIHHTRIYRLPGKKSSYGMLRVFTCDLLKHGAEDLFTVDIPPQSISMRTAEPKVRKALLDGKAEYLTWVVPGTEVYIPRGVLQLEKSSISTIASLFNQSGWWKIVGFDSPSRITMKPSRLSEEGLQKVVQSIELNPEDVKLLETLLKVKGWRSSVDKLLNFAGFELIYRNALGEVRANQANGMPESVKL